MSTNVRKKPLVSVCIANYNGLDMIGPCIDSVLKQDTNIEIEILIHDDASTDNSCEFIKDNYPDVKLIVSESNVGYCVSNNKLANSANGDYLLFLNNDATLFSDAIQSLAKYAESVSHSCILSLPQYDLKSRQLIDRGSFFDPFLNPVANTNPQITSVGMVIGACLWIPISTWDEIGGFPEWFESLSEDMYICLSALVRGYEIHVLNCSGYFHLVGGSFGGGKLMENRMVTTIRRRQLSERNKSYILVLFYPTLMLVIFLPIHLFLLIVEGCILSLIKRQPRLFSLIYLNVLISLWNNKAFLIQQRKNITKLKVLPLRKFVSYFVYYPYKLKMLFKHGIPSLK